LLLLFSCLLFFFGISHPRNLAFLLYVFFPWCSSTSPSISWLFFERFTHVHTFFFGEKG
jgi:hypothetical protein